MSVALALVTGCTASQSAGLERCADDREIGLGLSCDDAARGCARVCAVETEADAADQVANVVLGETRIGASRAGDGAVEAIVDTA